MTHPPIDPPDDVPIQVRQCDVCRRETVWFEDHAKPPASFAGMSPMGHWQWTCTGKSVDEFDQEGGAAPVSEPELLRRS
jgi:hypothetical protein